MVASSSDLLAAPYSQSYGVSHCGQQRIQRGLWPCDPEAESIELAALAYSVQLPVVKSWQAHHASAAQAVTYAQTDRQTAHAGVDICVFCAHLYKTCRMAFPWSTEIISIGHGRYLGYEEAYCN